MILHYCLVLLFVGFGVDASAQAPRSTLSAWKQTLTNLAPGFLSITATFIGKAAASSSSGNAITIIGANGKTGRKAVEVSLRKGLNTFAVTRSGVFLSNGDAFDDKKLTNVAADITKSSSYDALRSVLKVSNACIFAASASKDGGTPDKVDRDGLVAVAKACIDCKVPRLVIVSSGAVSKPFSPVYIFLNLFGGIMKAKIQGEDEVRRLYAVDEVMKQKLTYTIIRPGGLTEDEALGVSAVELNQGDDRSGRISRWDVASIAVESIASSDAEDTTFECYNADTSKPLGEVGLNNILKKTSNDDDRSLTGRERRGASWSAIFKGLSKDAS